MRCDAKASLSHAASGVLKHIGAQQPCVELAFTPAARIVTQVPNYAYQLQEKERTARCAAEKAEAAAKARVTSSRQQAKQRFAKAVSKVIAPLQSCVLLRRFETSYMGMCPAGNCKL